MQDRCGFQRSKRGEINLKKDLVEVKTVYICSA